MKAFLISVGVVITLVLLAGTVTWGVWAGWSYPRTYSYALLLCDDASLPKQKREFLEEYRERVGKITGPPRYVFRRPDLALDKQLLIVDGLITRLSDIEKVEPSSMAYQQGMAQVNEEMEHQMARIDGIFKSAAFRESFIFFAFCVAGPIGLCFMGFTGIVWLFIVTY